MKQSYTDKINIFITVDLHTINSYFNAHDPSPLYKKQVSQKFEKYILKAVKNAKRYSAIFYKLNCPRAIDKQYTEPLMYAVKRHFSIKKEIKIEEFKKFKRRNIILLIISGALVLLLEAFLPLYLQEMGSIYNGVKNCLDVFSWVILWKPIHELLFSWNPYLKQILLLQKLSSAEEIIVEDKKSSDVENHKPFNLKNEVEISNSLVFDTLLH